MTEQRVMIVGAASQAVIRAIVGHLDNSDQIDVVVTLEEPRRRRSIASIMGDMLAGCWELPAALLIDPEDRKEQFQNCRKALARAQRAMIHRARTECVRRPPTLMAYNLARDGPQRTNHSDSRD